MLSRFSVLLPLVLSLVAFVLTNLCLFAGRDKGFMEDYAIARVNTSMLGHNMIQTTNSSSSSDDDDDDDDDSFLDKLEDKWDKVKTDITNEINNITNHLADELADALGISEWYSIHVIDSCEGEFKPNATAENAGLNVTKCTHTPPAERFNLTKMLDKELDLGPFNITLADLDWPDDIDDAVDTLNGALLGLFILYVLGVGFSGLAMIACVLGFLFAGRRVIVITNVVLASLAATSIFAGSIVVTVAADKAVKKLNRRGENVGLSATKGDKFITLTWVSAAFMLAATLYWTVQNCLIKKEMKREWKERKGSL